MEAQSGASSDGVGCLPLLHPRMQVGQLTCVRSAVLCTVTYCTVFFLCFGEQI